MKLLLVDDDLDLLAITGFALQQAGFLVVKADTFDTAIATFRDQQPDLAILDINLPGGSGFDLCASLRKESRLPILMLTARHEESDLVRALELGADDYLTKPFSPRTLVARVRALLRRVAPAAGDRAQAGPLHLDLDSLVLHVEGGAEYRVTPLESRLLQLLIAHAGQPVASERLLAHIWGYRGSGDRQLLKQLVHRLRNKLGGDVTHWIETVPNVGYRLRLP